MVLSNTTTIIGSPPSKATQRESSAKTRKVYGFQYPIGKNSNNGYFARESGIELVRSLLRQIIRTEKGERLMLPNFGCGLKKYLFEPMDQQLFSEIRENILDSLRRYAPGVRILKFSILPLDKYGSEGLQAFSVNLTVQISEIAEHAFDVGLEVI